jgi:hypothetical protein
VGKFGATDQHIPHRHHDTIEFPDGGQVLVTLLCEGQYATVLQLPVVQQAADRVPAAADTRPVATPISAR